MRKRVYIAGPISKGDLAANINQATAAFISLARAGLAPFCPHWSVYCKPAHRVMLLGDHPPGDFGGVGRSAVLCEATADGNGGMTHADWLDIDLEWVRVSDAVLRLPGESAGADTEVAEANRRGIPVFDSAAAVVTWSRDQSAGP